MRVLARTCVWTDRQHCPPDHLPSLLSHSKRACRTGGPFMWGTQYRLSSMFLMHKANRCAPLICLAVMVASYFNLQCNAAAGAPKKHDDLVPDEHFDPPSPNLDSQQPTDKHRGTW